MGVELKGVGGEELSTLELSFPNGICTSKKELKKSDHRSFKNHKGSNSGQRINMWLLILKSGMRLTDFMLIMYACSRSPPVCHCVVHHAHFIMPLKYYFVLWTQRFLACIFIFSYCKNANLHHGLHCLQRWNLERILQPAQPLCSDAS